MVFVGMVRRDGLPLPCTNAPRRRFPYSDCTDDAHPKASPKPMTCRLYPSLGLLNVLSDGLTALRAVMSPVNETPNRTRTIDWSLLSCSNGRWCDSARHAVINVLAFIGRWTRCYALPSQHSHNQCLHLTSQQRCGRERGISFPPDST